MASSVPVSTLLLATLPAFSLSDGQSPTFLSPAIKAAKQAAQSRLIIVLISRCFNKESNTINNAENFHHVQRLLTYVYVEATKEDEMLFEIDVLLRGCDEELNLNLEPEEQVDTIYSVSGDSILVPLPTELLSMPRIFVDPVSGSYTSSDSDSTTSSSPPSSSPSTYPVSALGGTFDHLHSGHKILLSMGAFITSKRLIVGVTHPNLLVRKANGSLIEPLETRIEKVRRFLTRFKPELKIHDIVPIEDVAGPTAWDTEVEALVVSRETLKGADEIAKLRASKSLGPLKTFVIDVISSQSSNLDDSDQERLRRTKMSSTAIREWLARRNEK